MSIMSFVMRRPCTVVNKKPTVKIATMVGEGTVYKAKTEAEGAMSDVWLSELYLRADHSERWQFLRNTLCHRSQADWVEQS